MRRPAAQMSKKQLDDANEEATPRSTMAQLDAPKFPVFDPVTPKVSTLSIGMRVLESAIELVNEAEQQTAKFHSRRRPPRPSLCA